MITILSSTSPLARATSHMFIRFPLVAFFVLTYLGSWLALLPLLLSHTDANLLPYTLPTQPFETLSALTGPMLASTLVTAVTGGKTSLRSLCLRLFQWRVSTLWYALALFGFPSLFLVAASASLGSEPCLSLLRHWSSLFSTYLLPLGTLYLVGAVGEEIGWRGFALPRLQQRYGP
ncbi:MAG TPA: hypothetical protein VFV38_24890, partial [Ktedonobacteraceae bacterium]|nr:hypothetical protein [Ktedonobacteraceae bacterium]